MQTHSRRRKAFGLAALSLGATGAVFGQAQGAPGTAKEPRPASHFRLVLQGVEGAGLIQSRNIKNGSLVLKDFKKRQVFSYKAGRRLSTEAARIDARIDRLPRLEDVYTRAQADAAFLTKAGAGVLMSKEEANQTFLTQSAAAPFLTEAEADALFLTPAEADATYAKKADDPVISGSASVPYGDTGATILQIPGVGTIHGYAGSTVNSFKFTPSDIGTTVVNSSSGSGGSSSPENPYSGPIAPGSVLTLHIVLPTRLVTVTLSADPGSVSPRRMNAQAIVG